MYEELKNHMADLKQQMEDLEASLKKAKDNFFTKLKNDFPLNKFLNKQAIYHRCTWGPLGDNSNYLVSLNNELINRYSYLEAHNIYSGEHLNNQFEVTLFIKNEQYIMYVIYDECMEEEDFKMPIEDWMLYEYLIVKI